MKRIESYTLPNGKSPFVEWISSLPLEVRWQIDAYIDRVARGGGRKNVKALGDGVFEIKINTGLRYRSVLWRDKKCHNSTFGWWR